MKFMRAVETSPSKALPKSKGFAAIALAMNG
jgi:hypothetical protein